MKEITKKLEMPAELASVPGAENLLFMDIETTGLTAYRSRVYLIGCCRAEQGMLVFRQWLTNRPEEEPEVLVRAGRIYQEMGPGARIVTFNGEHFDLPFLSRRCGAHGIPDAFLGAGRKGLDIYRKIRPCRKLLDLPNLKQKTAEKFLGIGREDRYSGGELIRIYHQYEAHPGKEAERLLLLHNEEDVLAMPRLLPLLSYTEFLDGNLVVTETVRLGEEFEDVPAGSGTESGSTQEAGSGTESCGTQEAGSGTESGSTQEAGSASSVKLTAALRLNLTFPRPVLFESGRIRGFLKDDGIQLTIPEYNGTLRYYLPDYRNYYYLPEEGMAVHRSVASFVDRDYRQPATPDTAFLKKDGNFLLSPGGYSPDDVRLFSERRGTESWLAADSVELESPDFWTAYLRPVAKGLRRGSGDADHE